MRIQWTNPITSTPMWVYIVLVLGGMFLISPDFWSFSKTNHETRTREAYAETMKRLRAIGEEKKGELDHTDPFTHGSFTRLEQVDQSALYVSTGPDRDLDSSVTSAGMTLIAYDPTNGIDSNGDIFLTQ